MRIKSGFEVVNIGDEYMLIPVRDEANLFHGVVAINEETSFLIRHMQQGQEVGTLADLLSSRYDVDSETATRDIKELLYSLDKMGVVES